MQNIWITYRILISLMVLGCSESKTSKTNSMDSSLESHAYVLSENEGEIFAPDRGGRTTMIKVSPKTGSKNISLMIQKMPPGTEIVVHKHENTEEVFFVKSGVGNLILEDDTLIVKEGHTIYVPPGTWHGFENVVDSLYLVFAVSPPGLEDFFREVESHGNLSPEVMDRIGRKHDAISRK